MNSQDEPAVQVALKSAITKLLIGIAISVGAKYGFNDDVAITALVTVAVGAVWVALTGWIIRSKVFSPRTVEQLAPGATGDPVLEVPINR